MFQISSGGVITQMPSPRFSDARSLQHEINIKRTLDGGVRTYVKHKPRRRFVWQFRLARMKALEVMAFIETFHSSVVTVVDHYGEEWSGYFTNNPFELDSVSRALGSVTNGVLAETVEITLEFQATIE